MVEDAFESISPEKCIIHVLSTVRIVKEVQMNLEHLKRSEAHRSLPHEWLAI